MPTPFNVKKVYVFKYLTGIDCSPQVLSELPDAYDGFEGCIHDIKFVGMDRADFVIGLHDRSLEF